MISNVLTEKVYLCSMTAGVLSRPLPNRSLWLPICDTQPTSKVNPKPPLISNTTRSLPCRAKGDKRSHTHDTTPARGPRPRQKHQRKSRIRQLLTRTICNTQHHRILHLVTGDQPPQDQTAPTDVSDAMVQTDNAMWTLSTIHTNRGPRKNKTRYIFV